MADPCGDASARWTIQSDTYSMGAIHAGRRVRTRDRPVGDPAARLLVAGPDLVPDRGRRAGTQPLAAALVPAERRGRAVPLDDHLRACAQLDHHACLHGDRGGHRPGAARVQPAARAAAAGRQAPTVAAHRAGQARAARVPCPARSDSEPERIARAAGVPARPAAAPRALGSAADPVLVPAQADRANQPARRTAQVSGERARRHCRRATASASRFRAARCDDSATCPQALIRIISDVGKEMKGTNPMAHEVTGVIARAKGAPVELTTVIVPDPDPGEALVRIQACGVCHTDLHYREGGIGEDFPYLLGHEAAGVVEAVGEDVSGLAPGDLVILNLRAGPRAGPALPPGRPG